MYNVNLYSTMMKKLYAAALMMAVVLPVAAQDTYESARLLGSDLNGTARYVGMGGAMEALRTLPSFHG